MINIWLNIKVTKFKITRRKLLKVLKIFILFYISIVEGVSETEIYRRLLIVEIKRTEFQMIHLFNVTFFFCDHSFS